METRHATGLFTTGLAAGIVAACAIAIASAAENPAVDRSWASDAATLKIVTFLPERPISRAKRPAVIAAIVENSAKDACEVRPQLLLPPRVRLVGGSTANSLHLGGGEQAKLSWTVEADAKAEVEHVLRLRVTAPGRNAAECALSMRFLPPLEQVKAPYIPAPQPVRTRLLVGAHHCPLWEADKTLMWANIVKHPERTPALGFYAQDNPEISDWETKWAVEHGVSFFVYCWYRTSQGGPVTTQFASAIHDGLFRSRFADKIKFTIMWENQSRGRAGVADEKDLLVNLLPYWVQNYFKHPSYLKVDNKPVLFIYRPEFLVDDLGGEVKVAEALAKMRQACRAAGFDGLHILGEYRGLDANHLRLMKRLGLDYTFAYCWHVADSPTPARSIETQMRYIRKTQELNILPQVVTVSQAWSGWNDEGSIWKIPPSEFQTLLQRAKEFVDKLPQDQLSGRMLLLDNWNEWGEGHYIAPYREYGFGYLDAVRRVFADGAPDHVDLIPDDIGLGPYDTAYRAWSERRDTLRRLVRTKDQKGGQRDQSLIGWWAFDEPADCPVAIDYSGNRRGGLVHKAARAPGVDGNALVCRGGWVLVDHDPALSPTDAISIECWVRTDVAGQRNAWMVNRVFGGGTSTGYRLGVLDGKPCFEVPQTEWSHHLQADRPLPTRRWVHLAGTFDGTTMRIYVDGQLRGTMRRPGPINRNQFHLCLGNYEENHQAFFQGLLDEVRLYSRALSAEEINQRARQFNFSR